MSSAVPTNAFTGRRFRPLKTLGEGTFGAVYLAEMLSMGGFKKQVALKLLHSNWNPESDAGRRLRDEARLLGRLNHRHIVRVDDLIRVQGQWALVMEYVSGVDLEALIGVAREQGGKIPPRVAVELGAAIADALYAARTAEGDDGRRLAVVHRDIKPSNVLVSEAGDVKVLDFGVARAEFAGREARTERVRYGSMGYMSPERVTGGDETSAGDIYALGVVLYELITLQTFGRAELKQDAHIAKIARAQEWVRTCIDAPALIALIGECLAYEPEARPDDASAARRLREILREMPGDDVASFARAFVPVARERLAVEQPPAPEGEMREDIETASLPPASAPPLPPPAEVPRPLLIAVGVIGALVVVLGGAVLWRDSQSAALTGALPTPAATPATTSELAPAAQPTLGATPAITSATPAPEATLAATVAPATPGAANLPATAAKTPEATAKATAAKTPEATPATAAKTPEATPATVAKTPEATSATAAKTPEATPAGPLLRSVKVTLTGGTGLTVACGGVRGSGESSALLRDVPAGICVIQAGGQSARVEVREPRLVACALADGGLTCR